MKKALAVALGIFALAPFALAQGKNADAEQKLVSMEKQLWEAWKNKNADPFRQDLTDDSINVTPGGVSRGKDKAADEIAKSNCEVRSYSLGDTKVDWLSKDMALLTYKAEQDATCEGQKLPAAVYASSIWAKKGGKWLAAFHQETAAAGGPSQ